MIEKKVIITNNLGMCGRTCAFFVKTAYPFKSTITVSKDNQEVNGKSIMSLMILAAEKGAEITIRANGEDEQEAIDSLVQQVESWVDDY